VGQNTIEIIYDYVLPHLVFLFYQFFVKKHVAQLELSSPLQYDKAHSPYTKLTRECRI